MEDPKFYWVLALTTHFGCQELGEHCITSHPFKWRNECQYPSVFIVDMIHNWKEITEREWDSYHQLVRSENEVG